MRKRLFILLFFLVALLGETYAQYEPPVFEMPKTRNTIGLNISPAVVLLLNAYSFNTRYSLTYKRQTDVNKKIKLTINYEIRERYEEDLATGSVIHYSDSTINYKLENADHYSWDVRIGMEWFKPDRKASLIYSFDIFGGMMTEIDGYDIIPRFTSPDGQIASPYEERTSYEQKIEYAQIGFDFAIGEKFITGDKTYIVIQWTPQFAYQLPINEYYSDPSERDGVPSNGFAFNLRGIEVYLNYVF